MTAVTENTKTPERDMRDGLLSALIAYVVWGLLPIYFIFLKAVGSTEVLAHRIIWAVPFGALIIHFRRQWPEVVRALSHPTMLKLLCITALLITGNWFVYIIAVQQEQIFQASLGYYINPLLFAVVGVFVLGEQLRLPQAMAVLLAGVGVLVLTFSGGQFPWIALFLGVSFTIYGVIRKKVVVGGMPGLFVETIVLVPFALVFLGWLMAQQQAAFYGSGVKFSVLLALAGPLTVIPLLFFALAARRLNLTTVGMMQFIAPSLQFLVGVYSGEVLTAAHLVCFACIWAAVLLFSWDAWRNNRRNTALVT
ncbi:MAG: EamA family transporter RarD [Woeseiaceae bacterium]|nr:EamA family transporter RarD [Woeseiaceae bacterium]